MRRSRSAAVLALVPLLLLVAATPAAATPEGPDWLPLRGTHAVWCTMSNPGWSGCAGHHGTPAIDIGMPVGTPVYAAGPGTVHEVSLTDSDARGLFVALAHPDGRFSRYLHLSRVDVSPGSPVQRGQQIGLSGNTGSSSAPHLHFDIMAPYGTRIDPGSLRGIVAGELVTFPEALGHSTWWTVPFGSALRNDGFPLLFLDVGDEHPFLGQIAWLVQAGITTGYADGTFRSHAAVTRQAMAAFLYRLERSPPGPFPSPPFSDVGPGHPFATEIAWLAHTGITTGFDDASFGSLEPVTRQAMAAFLYRLEGSPPGPFPSPPFSDVGPGHPFATEIAWLAHAGITTGYADGSFRPSQAVSRQAMAAFLFRLGG